MTASLPAAISFDPFFRPAIERDQRRTESRSQQTAVESELREFDSLSQEQRVAAKESALATCDPLLASRLRDKDPRASAILRGMTLAAAKKLGYVSYPPTPAQTP